MSKWVIYLTIAALVLFFISRNKTMAADLPNKSPGIEPVIPNPVNNSNGAPYNITQDIIDDSLGYILNKYGVGVARDVERIYRVETAHFTSGQFKNTLSPGMEKHAENFPYGWTSMKDFWLANNINPTFYSMPENKTGIRKVFVRFANLRDAMESLAYYIKKYKPERWYSLNPESQARYRNTLNSVVPRITNKLYSNS